MKRMLPLVALTLAMLPLATSAQPLAPSSQPALTVAGDGLARRSPDRARVALDIITTDAVAARSGALNTTIYNAFVARVGTFGIAASDVLTTSYDVSFIPYPPKDLPAEQRQARYGFITSRALSVLVNPLENTGKVVDAATAAGVTQVGGVSFELKDRKAAYLAALADAMHDAKSTASAAAAAGGFHIIRIRSIDIGSQPVFSPAPLTLRRVEAAASAAPPTDIAPNEPIDVTAHVTITYAIE